MVFKVELVRTVTQRTTVNVEAMSIEDARNAGDCLGWYFAGDVPPGDWWYDGVTEGDTEAGDVQEAPPGEKPWYYWVDGQEVSGEEYRECEAEEQGKVTATGERASKRVLEGETLPSSRLSPCGHNAHFVPPRHKEGPSPPRPHVPSDPGRTVADLE